MKTQPATTSEKSSMISYRGKDLSGEELATIVTNPDFQGVRVLDLNGCKVGVAGLKSIANSKYTGSLRVLWVDQTQAGDDGLAHLAESRQLKLKELYIGYNKIRGPGLATLTGPSTAEINILRLNGNPLGEDGAKALAQAKVTPKQLYLALTKLNDSALNTLVSSPVLKEVETLDLTANAITAKGLSALANRSALPRLAALYVDKAALNPAILAELRKSRPTLTINSE